MLLQTMHTVFVSSVVISDFDLLDHPNYSGFGNPGQSVGVLSPSDGLNRSHYIPVCGAILRATSGQNRYVLYVDSVLFF